MRITYETISTFCPCRQDHFTAAEKNFLLTFILNIYKNPPVFILPVDYRLLYIKFSPAQNDTSIKFPSILSQIKQMAIRVALVAHLIERTTVRKIQNVKIRVNRFWK